MAPLTSPLRVPVGLVHQVLGTVSTADTWRGDPALDTFAKLVGDVSSDDAAILPAAVGECLLPLRGDPAHLHLALDMIRQFDLFEATAGLATLVRETPTRRALVTAAAMASHPVTPGILRELVQMAVRSVEDRSFQPRLDMLLEGRLEADATEADRWLYLERWPGRVPLAETVSPALVVTTDAARPLDVLRFALDCRRSGALVRRVPPEAERPPDGWLPLDAGLLIARDERPEWWPPGSPVRRTSVIFTHGSLSTANRRAILQRAGRVLPGRLALRQIRVQQVIGGDLPDPLVNVDAFFGGALLLPEVRLLSGWATDTIRKRAADYRELNPKTPSTGRGIYFDFGQLTALRIERFVLDRFGRKPSAQLAAKIVSKVRSRESVPIVITEQGEVLFEEDQDTFRDVDGQGSFRQARLHEIANRFDLSRGGTVPDLRRPSEHTSVHPEVQLGSPVVRGTRIPATAVRDVMARGRAGGYRDEELIEWTRRFFHELEPEQLLDADDLGQKILV